MQLCLRYAAGSLIGSIAVLGGAQIDAMGGPKLVRPLMWVLRNGDWQPKYAAMRALAVLSQDIACRTVMARVRLLVSTGLCLSPQFLLVSTDM